MLQVGYRIYSLQTFGHFLAEARVSPYHMHVHVHVANMTSCVRACRPHRRSHTTTLWRSLRVRLRSPSRTRILPKPLKRRRGNRCCPPHTVPCMHCNNGCDWDLSKKRIVGSLWCFVVWKNPRQLSKLSWSLGKAISPPLFPIAYMSPIACPLLHTCPMLHACPCTG